MATKKEEVKFEDNLAELENIVRKLESGDVALEDAIAEFQKGMKISETLKKTLNEAEQTFIRTKRILISVHVIGDPLHKKYLKNQVLFNIKNKMLYELFSRRFY